MGDGASRGLIAQVLADGEILVERALMWPEPAGDQAAIEAEEILDEKREATTVSIKGSRVFRLSVEWRGDSQDWRLADESQRLFIF